MTVAQQIMNHAVKNYNHGGWDFVVECWSVDEIEQELIEQKIETFAGAKKYFRETYGLIDEQRQEIKSFAI